MKLRSVRAESLRRNSFVMSSLKCLCVFFSAVLITAYGNSGWALQRHELTPGQATTEDSATSVAGRSTAHSQTPSPTAGATAPVASQLSAPSEHPPPPGSQQTSTPSLSSPAATSQTPSGEEHISKPSLPMAEGDHTAIAPPEGLPEHDEEEDAHVEHGVVLPKISPTPGVSFVETMISLMEHELSGRTLGWRPNDIILGRLTDNINSFQLGVLEALRFTTLRLKDSLTRMGDADAYDPDLEAALNLLMNRATLFWFPSAENSYGEAVDHLKQFLVKLEKGQRHFYYRSDNLQLLISTYRDLMGNVNRNLIRENVGWFESDDYFYYAKGVAHVYFEILKVVRVGFESQLALTLDAVAIMDEVLHELYRAEQMDPWLVLNAGPNSFLANHRANLNAPLSEVAHLLVILSQL